MAPKPIESILPNFFCIKQTLILFCVINLSHSMRTACPKVSKLNSKNQKTKKQSLAGLTLVDHIIAKKPVDVFILTFPSA